MEAIARFAHEAPLILVAFLLLAAMMLGRELGEAAHRKLRARAGGEDESSDEGYILTAVFGLLALLVAFTFGLALDRHETRRALVVTEANALGTAYLRTSLLDNPERLRSMLRTYAEHRLAYGRHSGTAEVRLERQTAAMQEPIWREAADAVRPLRTTPMAPMLLGPINEAFDAASARKAALAARLPLTVLISLALYAMVSAAVLGYAVAGAGARHRVASLVLFSLLTLAIVLILDLDRSRSGVIHVPQDVMEDLLVAMADDPRQGRKAAAME